MDHPKRVVLAGGSGFLGRALQKELESAGYETAVLTRSPRAPRDMFWDGQSTGDWVSLLEGACAVVNLTGKSVNCRYTPENKREIMASRVDSVRVLGEALRTLKNPPPVWIQTSSLAIYGSPGDVICDENSPHGSGFSVEVCESWEGAFFKALPPQTRGVALRIGFVLGEKGGALGTLGWLTKMFLGGAVGSGKQYISWLHLHDMNRIFRLSIENGELAGAFNATGPNPVTNAAFMASLRGALHRPWSPPVPAPFVKIGTFLLNTEAELALTGRRCIPKRLGEAGFEFELPELDMALAGIYAASPSP
jgi:uncharacterized protein (TIGR01777 family)